MIAQARFRSVILNTGANTELSWTSLPPQTASSSSTTPMTDASMTLPIRP